MWKKVTIFLLSVDNIVIHYLSFIKKYEERKSVGNIE